MITKISQSAKTYADALIKSEQDKTDILKNLEIVSEIIKSSDNLRTVLNSPAISTEKKIEIIDEVFKIEITQTTLNFLKLLAEKKRFNEFEYIVQAYKDALDKINRIQKVTVISAIELTEEYKKLIIEKLGNKLNKNIHADWQTDESIIGGLVINIDDNVIDASIKFKLENLSKNIIKGNL